MSTPVGNNTEGLQEILRAVQSLPSVSDGKDGTTFIPNVDSNGNLSWTNDGGLENPETVNIKGHAGKDGGDGVGIRSVTQTTTSNADGGTNIITVTKTDGSTSTFSVKNGSKGSNGADGKTPVKGTDYWTAADKTGIVNELKNTNLGYVKTINGEEPDENGNVNVDVVPTVTAADNGKFLRVVNGAWTAEALTNVAEEGA